MVFTPHFFLFSMVYTAMTVIMFFLDSFYYFWIFMELSTLTFMGMSYSVFKNSMSSLLIFFIIQAVSAFLLLLFFILGFPSMMTMSMLLKLSMFPFHFWFVSLIVFFPNIIFFLASTVFKLPSIIMINSFLPSFNFTFFIFSCIFTLLLGGLMMIFSSDLRFILISSSVANNSWFFLSQFCNLTLFFCFWVVYSVLLLFVLFFFNGVTSFSFMMGSYNKLQILYIIFTMSGLPPFPLFFLKLFIVFNLFLLISSTHVLFILMSTLVLLVGYMKFCFTYMYFYYSSSVYSY